MGNREYDDIPSPCPVCGREEGDWTAALVGLGYAVVLVVAIILGVTSLALHFHAVYFSLVLVS